MDREKLPTEKVLSNMEILNFYANMFKDRMIASLIDLKHYLAVKEKNPSFTKMMPELGKVLTVNELINLNRTSTANARGNYERVQSLIELENNGKFDAEYSDSNIQNLLSAYQLDEEGNLVETNNKK